MATYYQYEITITDNKTGREYPHIYADRNQIGPKDRAQRALESKITWIKERARQDNRDITIRAQLNPTK